jgi:DNA-binding transcriptional LysR family regulator
MDLHPDLSFLRLRDLMLLDQVHRLGTLRAAAQHLHLTQPAVTQMLKGLEEAFGLPLVERGRRGVKLNAAGRAALNRLGCAFQEASLARQDAHAALAPLLHIGATPMASLQTLPRLVAHLNRVRPQARIVLSESGADSLWQQLAQGQLDVLLARLPNAQLFPGLRHEAVGVENMVLACNHGHPLLKRQLPDKRELWLEALAQERWVLPPENSLAMTDFNAWFLQAGLAPPIPSVTSGSFSASLHLVAYSPLLTLVPYSAFRGLESALGLRAVLVPWALPTVSIVFATRTTRWHEDLIQGLRESLRVGVSSADEDDS